MLAPEKMTRINWGYVERVLTKTTYIIKAAQLTIHDCLFKLFMKKSLQQESSIYETSRDQ